MANTRQHQLHERKLEELLKTMPFYVVEYVDQKTGSRSSSTLLNYVHDYKQNNHTLTAKFPLFVRCLSI